MFTRLNKEFICEVGISFKLTLHGCPFGASMPPHPKKTKIKGVSLSCLACY